MALFSKAILGLFGSTTGTDGDTEKPSQEASVPAADVHQAYAKAGKVVRRQGQPVLTPPTKQAASLDAPAAGMADVPEPIMHDPAQGQTSALPPAKAAAGAKGQGRAMTPERLDLIRRAMVVHRAKQGILASLTTEQRERLTMMALQAFRIEQKGRKKN